MSHQQPLKQLTFSIGLGLTIVAITLALSNHQTSLARTDTATHLDTPGLAGCQGGDCSLRPVSSLSQVSSTLYVNHAATGIANGMSWRDAYTNL